MRALLFLNIYDENYFKNNIIFPLNLYSSTNKLITADHISLNILSILRTHPEVCLRKIKNKTIYFDLRRCFFFTLEAINHFEIETQED